MFGKKQVAKKSEIATAIDVGNFSVKVLQMSRGPESFVLENFGYAKIENSKFNSTLEAIKKACDEAKITYKKVNSSIASEGAIVRYLLLPQMNYEDLDKAMEFEIERYVPFDKKDVISDYMVLQEKADNKNMKILLVAAKREYLDKRVATLKEAGLEPEIMTIDSLVLKNVFELSYPDKFSRTVGVLNIGAKVSNISIIKNGIPYFMRDIQLGGDNITQLLKEKLDISPEEAEKVKYNFNLEDKEKFKIIEPVLGNLLNEIFLSFDYYESEFGLAVEEVFICGGSVKLLWLKDFLKENLNREISVLNPLQNIKINPNISSQVSNFSHFLSVPIGLALETFN